MGQAVEHRGRPVAHRIVQAPAQGVVSQHRQLGHTADYSEPGDRLATGGMDRPAMRVHGQRVVGRTRQAFTRDEPGQGPRRIQAIWRRNGGIDIAGRIRRGAQRRQIHLPGVDELKAAGMLQAYPVAMGGTGDLPFAVEQDDGEAESGSTGEDEAPSETDYAPSSFLGVVEDASPPAEDSADENCERDDPFAD